jgi:cell division protein FtsI/penicillin-binding protein 2
MRGLPRGRRGTGRTTTGRTAAAAAVVLTLAGLPACGSDEDKAADAAGEFLTAWQAGDLGRAAGRTDGGDAAKTGLEEVRNRLSVSAARFEAGKRTEGEDGAVTVPFTAQLTLRALGTWSYDSALDMRKAGDDWRVHWSPAVIHPRLTESTRLRRVRELPPRAAILARDGSPLVTDRRVVTLGVWPSKLTDPQRAYAALTPLQVDTAKLAARVKAAKPDAFVEVISLREPEYEKHRERLRAVPGLVTREGTRPLAPTPTFARALLGSVSPATKESLANAGETASEADLVGASGLQFAFQKQLAGAPGGRVEIVDRKDPEVDPVVLHTFAAKPGEPLKTTLDAATQTAAEKALEPVAKPTSLVALQVSTGEVLAAANGPGGVAFNRAFVGKYPPGSTFKVVTTTALLAAGLKPTTTVACPESVTVSGKRFENQDSLGSLGSVPFRADFAHSCNTAFIGLRDKLPGGSALTDAAAVYGIGGEWKVGVPAFSGSVPPADDEVERAADMIGQGKIEASPLSMAAVAATVAAGKFNQPVVLPGAAERFTATEQMPPATLSQLRALMRAVVTEGSGTALRGISGAAAKTGTAEYGTDSPPRTHAWMIGYRGDVAFAVLVEDGGSGGKNAGPVAARFLSALR